MKGESIALRPPLAHYHSREGRSGSMKPLSATRKAPGEVSISPAALHHTPAPRTTTDGFAGHSWAFARAGAGL
jgi:hypothetical protein